MLAHTVIGGDGLELHVEETGDPAGKAILFIHGLSGCGGVWKRQLSSALAERFRLVAMDIRGHGLSAKPRDVYADPKLWADDLYAVIDSLELDKPVLSGWSYGGVIISDYVSFYGEDDIAGTNWVSGVSRLGEPLIAPGFLCEGFIPGVGHAPFWEAPERFNRELREFRESL